MLFCSLALVYHSCFCIETLFLDSVCSANVVVEFQRALSGRLHGRPAGRRHRGSNSAQLKRFNCCINISLKLAHCAVDSVQLKLRFKLYRGPVCLYRYPSFGFYVCVCVCLATVNYHIFVYN